MDPDDADSRPPTAEMIQAWMDEANGLMAARRQIEQQQLATTSGIVADYTPSSPPPPDLATCGRNSLVRREYTNRLKRRILDDPIQTMHEHFPHCQYRLQRQKNWIVHDGQWVCTGCGLVAGGYFPELPWMPGMPHSTYRRIHHYNERIIQFLCMDSPPPAAVMAVVRAWFAQRPTVTICKHRIREALRQVQESKYAEKWISIYCVLTGTPRPYIDGAVVDRMRSSFVGIEVSFLRHRPPGRKSMLNYNFVFVRQLQRFGQLDHFKYFPMLKSKNKVRFLDAVWKRIVPDLGWEYMPLPTAKQFR